jgi:hypothetical protein
MVPACGLGDTRLRTELISVSGANYFLPGISFTEPTISHDHRFFYSNSMRNANCIRLFTRKTSYFFGLKELSGFQNWKYYEQFWNQALEWLASR